MTRTWGQQEIGSARTAGPGVPGLLPANVSRSPRPAPPPPRRLPARGHQRAPLSTEATRPAARAVLPGSHAPRVTAQVLPRPRGPARPPPPTPPPSAPATWASLLFPQHRGRRPAPGPRLVRPPLAGGDPLACSPPHSDLCSKVTPSERPPLTFSAQEVALSLFTLSPLRVSMALCGVTGALRNPRAPAHGPRALGPAGSW